ncbi:MAG: hypothetical protein IKY22_00300 [Bacteroidales bacterium]|nr:hypothetical protein [Bacteroidales bacterium]
MKRYGLYTLAALMILFISCEDEYVIDERIYISNATEANVVVDNLSIASGKTILLGNTYDFDNAFPYFYFQKDTVNIIFNDSIVLKHFRVREGGELYYVPRKHNILNGKSWIIEYDYDSYVNGQATYTITEEDYQRALEQSGNK